MNEASEKCAAYFKRRPAFHRLLKLFLRKYEGFGRPAGTVCLSDATTEECDAVRGLFGHPFSPPLRIKTADFEAALQNTPYHGAVLKEVLEFYFDTTIQTKRERQEQLNAKTAQIIAQVRNAAQSGACRQWLDELSSHKGEGYRLIRTSAGQDAKTTQRAVMQACRSVDWLEAHPGERLRLAVLSANATSDPHALDWDTLCGKLFLHLLSVRKGCPYPTAAEERAALCYESGILCDSIASTVTQVGVRLYTGEGEHPAFRAFRQRNEAGTLTLADLTSMTAADSPSGRAYLVENQMVFSQLCDHAPRFHSPLICTSGQPSVASLRLLDLLVASGTELYYAGDFDGKGLSIAAQLLARYPEHVHLWHITEENYARCVSNVPLSDASLAYLYTCSDLRLAPVAEAVRHGGHVGYQELLLPQLLTDLTDTP